MMAFCVLCYCESCEREVQRWFCGTVEGGPRWAGPALCFSATLKSQAAGESGCFAGSEGDCLAGRRVDQEFAAPWMTDAVWQSSSY